MDHSYKDGKYFVDGKTYNCPFCNRRNVKYEVVDSLSFDWKRDKKAYAYKIKCTESECQKTSFHLSYYDLMRDGYQNINFVSPPRQNIYFKGPAGESRYRFDLITDKNGGEITELDSVMFFHQPTSFFTVDQRIPANVREPLSESENSLKNNFLTGASAGLRKSIYKLLKYEEIQLQDDEGNFLSYDVRIDLLAKKFSKIDTELFHSLQVVQGLTSQELHEHDWEDFDAQSLRFLHEVTHQLLYEMYVEPEIRKHQRKKILHLKAAAKPLKNQK